MNRARLIVFSDRNGSGLQPAQGYGQNFQPGYAPTYIQQGPMKQ